MRIYTYRYGLGGVHTFDDCIALTAERPAFMARMTSDCPLSASDDR
jgi:hypothetical protein